MLIKSNINSQICTICIYNDLIYTGSYKIHDNIRSGNIEIYNFDLKLLNFANTSGTFDLKVFNDFLYVASSEYVMKFNLKLELIVQYKTSYLNTFIHINNKIYVSTSIGAIDAYDYNLNKLFTIQISNDILWSIIIHENLLYCGGEDAILYCINLENNNILKKITFENGITSLFIDNGLIVGSYGEYVYKFDFNLENHIKYFIGCGIWRIIKYNSNYFISCMYEGVKIFSNCFDLVYEYKVGDLIYGIDICDNGFFFAQFYKKSFFKLLIKKI